MPTPAQHTIPAELDHMLPGIAGVPLVNDTDTG
jgi:hypothetical protein